MKLLKFLLIIFFFNSHAQTRELPRIDTKFYLGVYNSFDKLSATAHSIYHPEFIIEYDNTQNDSNHIHTVIRDIKNDWGENLLSLHYEKFHI